MVEGGGGPKAVEVDEGELDLIVPRVLIIPGWRIDVNEGALMVVMYARMTMTVGAFVTVI